MATRIEAPTEEELADAEAAILRRRTEEEFEARRAQLNATRPKGAAKISRLRSRAFAAATPPVSRGPIDVMPEDTPAERAAETPAETLRAVRTAAPAKPKKKGKFDVPEAKTPQTLLKSIGLCYVEDRKKDPSTAFENVRTAVMSNLDLLLPIMGQIKQMFELLSIGEVEKNPEKSNGKTESVAESMSRLRNWMQGDSEE